jgi:hypothetical protein
MSTESQKQDKQALCEDNRRLYDHVKALENRLLLINKIASEARMWRRSAALKAIIGLTTPVQPKVAKVAQ